MSQLFTHMFFLHFHFFTCCTSSWQHTSSRNICVTCCISSHTLSSSNDLCVTHYNSSCTGTSSNDLYVAWCKYSCTCTSSSDFYVARCSSLCITQESLLLRVIELGRCLCYFFDISLHVLTWTFPFFQVHAYLDASLGHHLYIIFFFWFMSLAWLHHHYVTLPHYFLPIFPITMGNPPWRDLRCRNIHKVCVACYRIMIHGLLIHG